ncbi:hypothetical protein [Ranid herpesvirus 3]|uniref:Uncharacterized protein n=1 Tax=Ranid herpesvirus 3 TaxID=1987509 RepID=A0A1X9T5A2_9VIRU|nr:hypothetical protein [Ranid herpesvirus 3]ARR28876.1 hypothetical protein [Ranid herpesvirus 3]
MAYLSGFNVICCQLSKEYKLQQCSRPGNFKAKPLVSIPTRLTNGIFVKLAPVNCGSEYQLIYPSVHGEHISLNDKRGDRLAIVVTPGNVEEQIEVSTAPQCSYELINTGKFPLMTNDVFAVHEPDKLDQEAQMKCLQQNEHAQASLCPNARGQSMVKLLGGLYATTRISPDYTTELRERLKRDLDIALTYEGVQNAPAPLPLDDIPMRTLQTAMNYVANAYALNAALPRNNPAIMAVVADHCNFLRNEANAVPATVAQMRDLFNIPAVRTAFAIAGEHQLDMHPYLTSDTTGIVLQSIVANPTPLSPNVPVYHSRQGTNLTGSRFYAYMTKFNGF